MSYEDGFDVTYASAPLDDLFERRTWQAPTQGDVRCAWCREVGMHPCEPIVHISHDDYDPRNPTKRRGDWIDQSFVCQYCDRHTALIFAFHKGSTGVGVYRKTMERETLEMRGAITGLPAVEEGAL